MAQIQPFSADDLINHKGKPSGMKWLIEMAIQAKAYFDGNPYPWFAFMDWKTEDRGPLPRCLPFVRSYSEKGARWLFGKPIAIMCPGNEKLQEYFRKAWQLNRMPTQMVMGATRGSYEGGIALKWSYDAKATPALAFEVLSVVQNCVFFFDAHDRDKVLLARIQYPYYNPVDGYWYWYREEWTDNLEIHYHPVKDTKAGSASDVPQDPDVRKPRFTDPDTDLEFKESSRKPNPFKVIPVVPIRNKESDYWYGEGDWWHLFRIVDLVNHVWQLMNRSNQMDANPSQIFLDVTADNDDLESPLAPSGAANLKSDSNASGSGKQGQAFLLEAKGALRPAMMEYAVSLKKQLLDAISSVEIRTEEVTNKGNMTAAVLSQLYAPLIESTEEKRKTYGEDGICKFLERCAIGLKNFGVKDIGPVSEANPDSYDVQIIWAPYFEPTAGEKSEEINNEIAMIEAGLSTPERAISRLAPLHKIEDVDALKGEIAAHQDKVKADSQEDMKFEASLQKPPKAPTKT